MKCPVAAPHDLGEDGDRKPDHQPHTRKTQLEEQRQPTDEKTQPQEGHHDPDPLAGASRLGCFEKPDSTSIEPLIVEKTETHTGRRGRALLGRNPHGEEASHQGSDSDDQRYGKILIQT